jgi:hypothetical protein
LDLFPSWLDHGFELLGNLSVWLSASVRRCAVEEVGDSERANEHDQDEDEGEQSEEPTVGKRGGVGCHGVLEEEVPDRAHRTPDDPDLRLLSHLIYL